MNDAEMLSRLALCHAPFIDRRRSVYATRLTVLPLGRAGAVDAHRLLAELAGARPADEGRTMSLNVQCETLLAGLLCTRPPANVMIEVPSALAGDPAWQDALQALREAGCLLLLRGRPAQELPRAVLPCFRQAIIDFDDDRRLHGGGSPAGVRRHIRHVQSGVRSGAALQAAFDAGAEAVVGWPFDDGTPASAVDVDADGRRRQRQNDAGAMQVVLELIDRVDRGEPVERLEPTLRRDPSVAFRLLRYVNSPAFGLRAEMSSFTHALAMLGHRRLKRWLVLLLATVGDDPQGRPLMHAAICRGLLMEELARASGDEETVSERFICGVFSLLDRIFGQPFDELLRMVPVHDRVVQALAGRCGPHHGWLQLVRAVESESPSDACAAAEALHLGMGDVNRALLRMLDGAAQLA